MLPIKELVLSPYSELYDKSFGPVSTIKLNILNISIEKKKSLVISITKALLFNKNS